LARGRRCSRAFRPRRTVESVSGSRSYQVRERCDSRSPQHKRSACVAWHSSAAVRVLGSPSSSTVDPPTGLAVPESSDRGRWSLVPALSTPRPFRLDALPPAFRSLVVSASPSPHSKYSAPRMLSCGGGGDNGDGATDGSASSEFFRIDLTL